MNDSQRYELAELILTCLDGEGTPQETAELAAQIADDGEARDYYLRLVQISSGLHWSRAHESATAIFNEASRSIEEPAMPRDSRFQRAWGTIGDMASHVATPSVILAAIVLALVILPFGLVKFRDLQAKVDPPEIDASIFVAQVVRTQDARWSATSGVEQGKVADLERGKVIELQAGLAELRFDSGATVLLEAPARLTPLADGRLELHSGKLTARVPKQAIGFTVQTAVASVVDLGTEFGVEIDANQKLELAVYEGKVEFSRSDSPPRVLGEGDAVRVVEDRVETIAPPKFVRQFRENPSISVNFYPVEHPQTALRERGVVRGVPVTCWNNFVVDNSGTPAELSNLIDQQGRRTACRIAVDAQAGWRVGLEPLDSQTALLEDGYWDSGSDDGRITISDLPDDFVRSGYLVVVYLHGTDQMGNDTAAEFGATVGGDSRWLRWLKNAADERFTSSGFLEEKLAEASLRDDNMLIFDNRGKYYTTPELMIDIHRDPDSDEQQWGRAAVSAIQVLRSSAHD